MRRFLVFAVKVIAFQMTTYFLAGLVAYPLLTKQFYVGPYPVLAVFMRTEAEPELFRHAVRWFLPAEFLRGLLMAAVLYPLFDTLKLWRFGKRFLMVASLYVVLGFWAAAVPAPGTIEGMVYLRPFITPHVHLAVQPETIGQGLALADRGSDDGSARKEVGGVPWRTPRPWVWLRGLPDGCLRRIAERHTQQIEARVYWIPGQSLRVCRCAQSPVVRQDKQGNIVGLGDWPRKGF